ncbi:MAG: hypothetical protein ABIT96_13920 [Ferruginibacter sp.]
MKKQIIRIAVPLFAAAALALTVPSQPGKGNKGNKENKGQQVQQKGNNKGQGKMDKGNNGQQGNGMKNETHGKDNKNDNHDNKGMGKNMNDNHNGKGNNEKMHMDEKAGMSGRMGNMNRDYRSYGYDWNRENFKDRNKLRTKDKVTICHKFNQANEPAVNITVSSNALKAHMAHGDIMGSCPAVNNSVFSDVFLRNRTDYYNRIEDTRDQVYYSQSILDYALQRLTNSRSQLSTMQNNNVAQADIQRKQATVNNLEQNVSLLEVALNLAAGYLTNRL